MNKTLLLLLALPISMLAQNRFNAERAAKQAAALHDVYARPAESASVADCPAVDVPYSENFNSVAPPAIPACATIENAGTGNNFETATNPGYGFSSNVLRYHWNTANAANAWFFTPGINMAAGTTYNISYKYGSAGAVAFTEKLKVHIGTSASVAGMGTTPLIDHPLVNNNVTPITDNLQFTPQTSGVYYVGFNCYSNPDQFYLFVDDIAVTTNLATAQQQAMEFSFSPNPVRDVLHINAASAIGHVAIFDLLGKKIREQSFGGNSADLSFANLANGTYLVEVSGANGRKMVKIIKQ
jgi:hypothetical protein